MVTMVGMSSDFKTVVKELIELEYDAMEAYKASISRLESAEYQTQLKSFLRDHEEHVSALTKLASELGVEAPTGPDAKQILTRGKVELADMVGDNTILLAMKTNEDDTVTAYERACAHKGLTDKAKPVMERGLSDERRHRAWMEETRATRSEPRDAA